MAENKQYVKQAQENGCVLISEDVIATIVTHALHDVEGVASLNIKAGMDIVELIGGKSRSKSVKVTVDNKNNVSIDCNVSVFYGQNVMDAAKAAQSVIASAVESMAGVTVANVNVFVCAIVRQ